MFSFWAWLLDHSPLTKMANNGGITSLLSSARGKTLLYDAAADGFRSKDTVLDSIAAITQVESEEGSTLRAPEGMHDDRADNNVLAAGGCQRNSYCPLPRRKTCSPSGQLPVREGGKGHTGSGKGTDRDEDNAAR